jgi:hypothetical protein
VKVRHPQFLLLSQGRSGVRHNVFHGLCIRSDAVWIPAHVYFPHNRSPRLRL